MFIWEEYGPGRTGRAVPAAMLVTAGLLLPLNTVDGLLWREFYLKGVAPLQRDVRDGRPLPELARRHRAFLYEYTDTRTLADWMRMLHDRGIGLFAKAVRDGPEGAAPSVGAADSHERTSGDRGALVQARREDRQPAKGARLVSIEVRYRRPEAGAVFLLWGVDGWNAVPEGLRPPGTLLRAELRYLRSRFGAPASRGGHSRALLLFSLAVGAVAAAAGAHELVRRGREG